MKNTIRGLFLLVLVYFQFSHCLAQKKDDGLLATPYPGSIIDPNRALSGAPSRAVLEARSREYFSKDPMEKVKAYYKTLGEFHVSPEGNHIYAVDVIPFKDVYDMVTKRGGQIGEGGESFFGGTAAGMTLYGKPLNTTSYSAIKVFERLEQAYLQRFQEVDNADPENMKKRLEDPELKQVESRYEHLKWSYFMQSNQKRTDGPPGNLSMDEVLFNKYWIAPEEALTKENADLQKKMTEATTQMKYDEATKLGDRMMKLMESQNDPKEHWKTALKCLEEMDKHAYATKIVIDMHPSKWDLTPPKD